MSNTKKLTLICTFNEGNGPEILFQCDAKGNLYINGKKIDQKLNDKYKNNPDYKSYFEKDNHFKFSSVKLCKYLAYKVVSKSYLKKYFNTMSNL